MRSFRLFFAALLLFALVAGCIKNDVPYPVIEAAITVFRVQGQKGAANINLAERSVTVDLADTVDVKKVKILQFEVSDNATVSPDVVSVVDMSQPLIYTLTTFQDYVWTIKATQSIERSIELENQVGSAIFDEFSKIAIVSVSNTTPLNNIRVKNMKIGPQGSVITPDFTTVTDFTTAREFKWDYKGRSETWLIKVVKSDVSVVTGTANAFAKYVMANGEFQAGSGNPTFVYRKASESSWTTFSGEVAVNGGTFSAKIADLEPSTEYVIKSKVGELYGSEVTFTTEAALQVENSDFENWIKEGKSWFPNLDLTSEHYWWDSGNRGANTLGEKNPTVAEESVVVKGKAAKLSSSAIVGVFAAGNIYTGKYVKTVGIGAQLDFGIPFTSRPSSLKGYYNYTSGTIDKTKDKFAHLKGVKDTCHIYAVLADWPAPYEINTTKEIFLDVANDKNIIAYGDLLDGAGTDGKYKEFEIKLTYRDLSRKPKYILIVAAASKYGDYFTGSTSSVLYVDEFSLSYD